MLAPRSSLPPSLSPVSIFSKSPKALRTLTISLAMMFSQMMDMMNAEGTRMSCKVHRGGRWGLNSRKSRKEGIEAEGGGRRDGWREGAGIEGSRERGRREGGEHTYHDQQNRKREGPYWEQKSLPPLHSYEHQHCNGERWEGGQDVVPYSPVPILDTERKGLQIRGFDQFPRKTHVV